MIRELLGHIIRKKVIPEKKEMTVMHDARQHVRTPQGKESSVAFSIAKFETLEKVDVTARALDICETGMGIEADAPLAPGFVWFREGAEHQCGIVVWTRTGEDNKFRAGIKFIKVGAGQEFTTYASALQPHIPSCYSPGLVASMLVEEEPPMER